MNALVRRADAIVRTHETKALNVVQFASEGIAADVRVFGHMYAIRLASTYFDVRGRLIGVLPGGETSDLGGLAVAPGSIGSARLAVAPPRSSDYETIYLEIRSEHLLLRVDAPRPAPAARKHRYTKLIVMAAAAAGASCIGFFSLAFPQAPMIAAPAQALAGAHVRIPYVSRGWGTLEYTASFDDGASVASGTLPDASGAIDLALAPNAGNRQVRVSLALRSPLGERTSDVSFAVSTPHAPVTIATPARVLSLAARRDQSAGGETVLASYLAIGDRGTLALIDPRGALVASTPFSHVGTTRLRVPEAYRAIPLTAKLTLHRGSTDAVASVVAPPTLVAAVPLDASIEPLANAELGQSPAARNRFSGIVAIEGRAVAGRPLRVRLMAQPSAVHVELQDPSGGALAERDIAAATTRFTLPLPFSREAQAYYLVVRYPRNGGEETVVHTLTASAR